MFTGIVEETGQVEGVTKTDDGIRLRISGNTVTQDLKHGQSINVSGACLTVERFEDNWFEVFLASETVERTYLGSLNESDPINLERSLRADGRFDGHIVQGHVDTTTEIVGIEQVGEDWEFEFSLPEGHRAYIAEKGSIAIDGISLTVAGVSEDTFRIAIIPTTYELTNLSEKSVGDPVNLEVDVVAKYVESIARRYVENHN
ncbi:MAG: riboflavin synthase [Halobacteria archaeon]|nr:riboflavin synthase [Halobacteria archaeon]